MDLRKLKTLIDLVSESNISELEITEAEGRVRIVKSGPPLQAAAAPAGPLALVPVAPAATVTAIEPEGRAVKSPMVGTFYRASSPGGKAFVDVGDRIEIGQPVCIVEAMKIMNEIEADCAGRVVRVLAENGQAVEFGQPLFMVE